MYSRSCCYHMIIRCVCVRSCVFTFSCEYQSSHLHLDKCGLDGHILWHAQAAIFPQVQFLPTFYDLLLNVKGFVPRKLLPAVVSCSQCFKETFSVFLLYSLTVTRSHFLLHPASASVSLQWQWLNECFAFITHTSSNVFYLYEETTCLYTHTG